jgi:hypothetical protein
LERPTLTKPPPSFEATVTPLVAFRLSKQLVFDGSILIAPCFG